MAWPIDELTAPDFGLIDDRPVKIGDGEADYLPPGGVHAGFVKGALVIELSSTDELATTMAVVERRVSAIGAN